MNTHILKSLHYIETHLDDNLDIHTLSKIAGYSPYYFCRIFKVSVGETVMSYASKLRIKQASSHIINSKKSIIEIALDIGFETPNGFNKAFKKIFSMTPTEYRQKHLLLLLNYKENKMQTPKIVQREEVTYIYNTKYGAYETSSQEAWDELIFKIDQEKRVNILSNSELLGICHNDPETTPEYEIRYDAAISCKEEDILGFKEKGFDIQKIEGGKFVCVSYKESEDSIKTWTGLFAWIVENDLANDCMDIPPFEKYINWSPNIDEKELIKEIYIPIK